MFHSFSVGNSSILRTWNELKITFAYPSSKLFVHIEQMSLIYAPPNCFLEEEKDLRCEFLTSLTISIKTKALDKVQMYDEVVNLHCIQFVWCAAKFCAKTTRRGEKQDKNALHFIGHVCKRNLIS